MHELLSVQHFSVNNGITLILNVSCLITLDSDLEAIEDSTSWRRLAIQRDVDVVIEDGRILRIGPHVAMEYEGRAELILSGSGLVVMPALVDAYASPSSLSKIGKEAVLRSQGVSAAELVAMNIMGAGARSKAAFASVADCEQSLMRFLSLAKNQGVALQEVKTGYCLSHADSLQQWQMLCRNSERLQEIEIHPSFYGLNHPDTAKRGMSDFLEGLISELPQIASACRRQGPALAQSRKLSAGNARVPLGAVDVNIDAGSFTKDLADKWLAAAAQHGLDVLIHGDRSARAGGAELAVELARRLDQKRERKRTGPRVLSVAHAKYSSESDLNRLAQLGVGVVILPTQNEFRGLEQNDAARMRASGVRVAIGSGYDPLESPFHNLWYSAYLALTQCGFSLPEVIGGVTREAAFALGYEDRYGTIQVGRPANLLAFAGDEPEDFMGSPLGENLIWTMRSALTPH